jgi:hypothetical protein
MVLLLYNQPQYLAWTVPELGLAVPTDVIILFVGPMIPHHPLFGGPRRLGVSLLLLILPPYLCDRCSNRMRWSLVLSLHPGFLIRNITYAPWLRLLNLQHCSYLYFAQGSGSQLWAIHPHPYIKIIL